MKDTVLGSNKVKRSLLLPLAATLCVSAICKPAVASSVVIDDNFNNGNDGGWAIETLRGRATVGFTGGEALLGLDASNSDTSMSLSKSVSVAQYQSFDLSFSYDWNFNEGSPADEFVAELIITDESDSESFEVFRSLSDVSSFEPQTFSTNISIASLAGVMASGIESVGLRFSLFEGNRTPGTVLNLDNVELTVVPLPAAAWLFGSALLGFMALSNRKSA